MNGPLPASCLFDLSGRVAIVTGGDRGLGHAIVQALAHG
jgi:NAD(P)-dependent dehydrogenase (short-subunit alcohol dehydrogenase family)